jgi:hypothetical protein
MHFRKVLTASMSISSYYRMDPDAVLLKVMVTRALRGGCQGLGAMDDVFRGGARTLAHRSRPGRIGPSRDQEASRGIGLMAKYPREDGRRVRDEEQPQRDPPPGPGGRELPHRRSRKTHRPARASNRGRQGGGPAARRPRTKRRSSSGTWKNPTGDHRNASSSSAERSQRACLADR